MSKPKIRFKGYTDEWEQRKLGEEAIEIIAGGDIDKSMVVENGKYPIYANALTDDSIVGYYDDYFRVKAPAVTVTGRGDVGHAQARTIDFTPVVRLLSIRSNHDCYFLENAINNHKVVVESTGVPQLTVPQLSSYKIHFPQNIDEEKQIGAYFRNLDHLITLHQCKCRFQDEMGASAWEQRKLEEEVNFYSGLTYSPDDVMDGKGTFVLRSSNVKNGEIARADDVFVNTQIVNSNNVKRGDIIVVVRNGSRALIGKHAQIKEEMTDTVIGAFMTGIRADQAEFINALLDTPAFDIEVKRNLGATINQITGYMFSKMEFLFPKDKEEQKRIGDCFTELDNLITLHQRKCDELQNIKKFMLQNMFV